jgi:hypothetical protein
MCAIRVQHMLDQLLRALVHQSGRIAVRVPQNLATRRIGRILIDPRLSQRLRIRETRVAAGVRQPNRIARRNAAQAFVHRKAAHVRLRRARSHFA